MKDVAPTTGPAADRAFSMGLVIVTIAAGSAILGAYATGVLSVVGAAVAILIGYPLVLLGAACVLGVWLGYAEEAQYQGAKYALEYNTADDEAHTGNH